MKDLIIPLILCVLFWVVRYIEMRKSDEKIETLKIVIKILGDRLDEALGKSHDADIEDDDMCQ